MERNYERERGREKENGFSICGFRLTKVLQHGILLPASVLINKCLVVSIANAIPDVSATMASGRPYQKIGENEALGLL